MLRLHHRCCASAIGVCFYCVSENQYLGVGESLLQLIKPLYTEIEMKNIVMNVSVYVLER